LDGTQNQQLSTRRVAPNTSSAGRSQEKETAILWPCSTSRQSMHTYPTWRHRWEQTPRKTTETLDQRHQTTEWV